MGKRVSRTQKELFKEYIQDMINIYGKDYVRSIVESLVQNKGNLVGTVTPQIRIDVNKYVPIIGDLITESYPSFYGWKEEGKELLVEIYKERGK